MDLLQGEMADGRTYPRLGSWWHCWQPFPEHICGCPVVIPSSLVRKLPVPQLLQASGAESPRFLCFLEEDTSPPAGGLGKLNKVTQRLKGKRRI